MSISHCACMLGASHMHTHTYAHPHTVVHTHTHRSIHVREVCHNILARLFLNKKKSCQDAEQSRECVWRIWSLKIRSWVGGKDWCVSVSVCLYTLFETSDEQVVHRFGSCSVLQCVAMCCSVLQCVTVCYSVLQFAAVCCSVLQRQNVLTARYANNETCEIWWKWTHEHIVAD